MDTDTCTTHAGHRNISRHTGTDTQEVEVDGTLQTHKRPFKAIIVELHDPHHDYAAFGGGDPNPNPNPKP